MKDWLSKLFADPSNLPDEARICYVVALLLYLLFWVLWAVHSGLGTWPQQVTPFTGGIGAISAAFGITVWMRGGK